MCIYCIHNNSLAITSLQNKTRLMHLKTKDKRAEIFKRFSIDTSFVYEYISLVIINIFS